MSVSTYCTVCLTEKMPVAMQSINIIGYIDTQIQHTHTRTWSLIWIGPSQFFVWMRPWTFATMWTKICWVLLLSLGLAWRTIPLQQGQQLANCRNIDCGKAVINPGIWYSTWATAIIITYSHRQRSCPLQVQLYPFTHQQ